MESTSELYSQALLLYDYLLTLDMEVSVEISSHFILIYHVKKRVPDFEDLDVRQASIPSAYNSIREDSDGALPRSFFSATVTSCQSLSCKFDPINWDSYVLIIVHHSIDMICTYLSFSSCRLRERLMFSSPSDAQFKLWCRSFLIFSERVNLTSADFHFSNNTAVSHKAIYS